MNVIRGDLVLPGNSDQVEMVTDENLSAFRMADVVLPLPGYSICYPDNDVGACYRDILNRDGIAFEKDAPEEATTKGSYRHLIAKATNLYHELLVDDEDSAPNVRFQFDLPKGSYATMFLRELMLTTVVRDHML
jgi:tRNA pseudouridine13 synthase